MDKAIFVREDCFVVEQVRRLGRSHKIRSTNWRIIARHLARKEYEKGEVGTFTVWRCDDTMVVFRYHSGKATQKSFPPNSWRFV